MLLFVIALLPAALACGPGTGPITAKPTMKFNYTPPLSWTFNKTPADLKGGQSISETAAQNRINADIEYAVIKAIESFGYSTSGVTVVNAIAPEEIKIVDTCGTIAAATTPPTCVAEGEAVVNECTGPTAGQMTVHEHKGVTITITSPVALAQSNWENIATKVWATLTTNAGVKFYGLIEVDSK